MKELINNTDWIYFEEMFNEYCLLVFDKLYPITDKNFKRYWEEALLNYYNNNRKHYDYVFEDEFYFSWQWDKKCLKLVYKSNNGGRYDDTIIIDEYVLCNKSLLKELNNNLRIAKGLEQEQKYEEIPF